MRQLIFLVAALVLTACQSPQQKSLDRVSNVVLAFRPHESAVRKNCKIRVELNGATEERYRQSFSGEKGFSEPTLFDWSVSEARCILKPVSPQVGSSWFKNHEVVVRAAVCTLVQGFGIESPFVGLNLLPADIVHEGEWSRILSSKTRRPAIEVHDEQNSLRVLGEKNQVYTADYDFPKKSPRLKQVKMESNDSALIVGDFQFQNLADGAVASVFPREIAAFSIFIRDARTPEVQLYSTVKVLECE